MWFELSAQDYVNLPNSHIDYQFKLPKHKESVPPGK